MLTVTDGQYTAAIGAVHATVRVIICLVLRRVGHIRVAADAVLFQCRLHIFDKTDGAGLDVFHAIGIGIVIAHIDAARKSHWQHKSRKKSQNLHGLPFNTYSTLVSYQKNVTFGLTVRINRHEKMSIPFFPGNFVDSRHGIGRLRLKKIVQRRYNFVFIIEPHLFNLCERANKRIRIYTKLKRCSAQSHRNSLLTLP